MVYKVDRQLVILTVILLAASLFFALSVFLSGMGNGGLIISFAIVAFIIFNIVVLFSKKIEVSEDEIVQTTIYGRKRVRIDEIEDIGIVKLRWRIILIISDPHKFVFISSLYEDFESFVDSLKDRLQEPVDSLIKPVTPKLIAKKRRFLRFVLVILTVFFIGSGVYNILYR
ncbi:hypothetical protein Dacet_1748 [Denitrovibrio acetiphilus DSM 12809]|uniref:PH domain-containing protein n=1 Tax=Denitrovibrio acetiphilus (strain DSM 12809 / NBRC 114555 / N2460) TaxID=522772 RepID=D4H0J9_DENA2|nr:hypothetical protein [Denitrovibrio acetiphilus]ADD68512.1 hypothetical protein Dacet_1748 [Denitrovibrio acetiphilus DSM 12809]